MRWHDRFMPCRVLLVDDNSDFRNAARQLLERHGFAVVAEAETGVAGIERAQEHRPDLALVDVQLPDIDGFEVAARLSRLEVPRRGDPYLEPRRRRFRRPRREQLGARFRSEGRVVRFGDRGAALAGALTGSCRLSRSRFSATLAASTSSSPTWRDARRRRTASCSPTTPCCCARASRACSRRQGFEIVGQSGTAEDLLLKVRSYKPDIAIVDIKMPPTHTDEGLRAAKEIREKHPGHGRARALAVRRGGLRARAASGERRRCRLPAERQGVRPGRLRRRRQTGRRGRLRTRSQRCFATRGPAPPRRPDRRR